MSRIVHNLWLIPALPLVAAAVSALAGRRQRTLASGLAVGSMAVACLLSCLAFSETLGQGGGQQVNNDFVWFEFGSASFRAGWVLDPLTAVMVVMVSLVGTLIFIYSLGYMAQDENYTRFFCFMSLFAAAMLGLVIANNLLVLFMCWELVGLASYLLIGFWYHKPSAAAAAQKAFITTRVGDVFFFLGMIWLYAETGTLLFYDDGQGCLEQSALAALVAKTVGGGMLVTTAVSLLVFCGAMGKSGQVPLHVWLPDAMEGPTPVSALIHAATMVAAGVFLVARLFPLLAAAPTGWVAGQASVPQTTALSVVTWVGAITAVFAALVAVAQTDIKRILAYSTVSQLGYMFLGLGAGGVAVGIFHLITHAFFKALLFLGAGSVIHGCGGEQDIRRMGGLRKFMPLTFATYAVGMMALSGVPLLFAGFWSKDEILHQAAHWPVSRWPFWLGVVGAFLTAFYMTRQVCYIFFGRYRVVDPEQVTGSAEPRQASGEADASLEIGHGRARPHESPVVMTVPLIVLAVLTVLLSLVATPIWPWFHDYLSGHEGGAEGFRALPAGVLVILIFSSFVALGGIGAGWWLYGCRPAEAAEAPDPLQGMQPGFFALLRQKFFVDELYAMSVVPWLAQLAGFFDWLDRVVVDGVVRAAAGLVLGISWLNRLIDEFVVNLAFDRGCESLRFGGRGLSLFQNGQVQRYLRVIGLALFLLGLVFIWGCR
jgi:NADH-quinone oxidoreductase subunit L